MTAPRHLHPAWLQPEGWPKVEPAPDCTANRAPLQAGADWCRWMSARSALKLQRCLRTPEAQREARRLRACLHRLADVLDGDDLDTVKVNR